MNKLEQENADGAHGITTISALQLLLDYGIQNVSTNCAEVLLTSLLSI